MREHADASRSRHPALQRAPEWARRRASRDDLPDKLRQAQNRLDTLEGIAPVPAVQTHRERELQLAEATL